MPRNLILPYVIEDSERKRTFSWRMEAATILCLAEAERKKPKILRRTPEDISYISKMLYPLWAFPWDEICLIIDGLGLSYHKVAHKILPDIKEFTEDLKRSTVSRGQYRSVLDKHRKTFREFPSTIEISLNAIIGDKEALADLFSFITHGLHVEEDSSKRATNSLIPPRIGMEEASEKAGGLIKEWRSLLSDIRALRYAEETLDKEMKRHEEKALEEVEELLRTYERRISEQGLLVEKRVREIMRKRETMVKGTVRDYEKRLKAASKEREKLELATRRLEQVLKGYEKRREALRGKKPRRDTYYWDSKIAFYRERIREQSWRVRAASGMAEKIRREGEETLEKIREDHQRMINKETEKIEVLKSSRELEVSKRRGEVEELQRSASNIKAQIGRLIQEKEQSAAMLRDMTVSCGLNEITLVSIPLYMVRYVSMDRDRIEVYPPVVAESYDGIIRRIQRAIWTFSLESRIRLLIRSRSKVFDDKLFKNLEKHLQRDKHLKDEMDDIGKSNNLLMIPGFRDAIINGLRELEEEGWINADEKNEILGIYT